MNWKEYKQKYRETNGEDMITKLWKFITKRNKQKEKKKNA